MPASARAMRKVLVAIAWMALALANAPVAAEEWKGVGTEQSGFVIDTRFMHQQLDFQFTAPAGTILNNTSQSIDLVAPTWNGSVRGRPTNPDLSAQLDEAFVQYAKMRIKLGAPVTSPVSIAGISGLQRTAPFRKGQRNLVLTLVALPWSKAMNFELATVAEAGNQDAAQFLSSFQHFTKPGGNILDCGNVKALNGLGENQVVTGHTIACTGGQANGQGKVKYYRGTESPTPCQLTATFADGLAQGDGEEACGADYSYEGGFVNGLHEGKGTMRFAQGKVDHGLFKQGKFWNGWSLNPVHGGGLRPDGLGQVYWVFVNGKNTGMCRPDANAALEANCTAEDRNLIVQQAIALNNPAPRQALAVGGTGGGAGTGDVGGGPAFDCTSIKFARNTPLPTEDFAKFAVCKEFAARAGHSYFRFISFAKTDGQLAELAHVQSYRLFFSATTEITRTTGSSSCHEGAAQQNWDCLMGAIQKRANGVNPGKVTAGARDQLSGVVTFEKFESGWKYNQVMINGR